MSDDLVSKPITSKDLLPLVCYGSGGTFLTITKDGKIIPGEGLSQDEATQATAKMLAEQFSALHQTQAAEIARLRAWREAIGGYLTERWNSPLRDDETPLAALKRIVQLELTSMALDPEIHNSINSALATARREGMEAAAKRLEELHKNHSYDPQTGGIINKLGRYDKWPASARTAKLEHDAGYYRAITEGVAHIRAAKVDAAE